MKEERLRTIVAGQAAMRQQYEQKYQMALTAMEVRQLAQMEGEQKICAGCNGLECKKSAEQWYQSEAEGINGRLYIKMRPCAHSKKIKQKRQSQVAGIPQCYASRRIEDYQWDQRNAEVLEMVEWYKSVYPTEWLYIYGGCGVGKTATVSLLGRELLLQGRDVVFRENQTMLEELKRSFDSPTETTSAVLERYATCEVLIIDDVGMGQQSGWGVGIMEHVINERYKAGLRTHLTTNYSFSELRGRLSQSDAYAGSRIISRLAEKACVLKMTGADRRWGKG